MARFWRRSNGRLSGGAKCRVLHEQDAGPAQGLEGVAQLDEDVEVRGGLARDRLAHDRDVGDEGSSGIDLRQDRRPNVRSPGNVLGVTVDDGFDRYRVVLR